MELLNNDLQLIVYRYVHRLLLSQVHDDIFEWLRWDDACAMYRWMTDFSWTPAFNWRDLNLYATGSIGFRNYLSDVYHITYNSINHVSKIPANYV